MPLTKLNNQSMSAITSTGIPTLTNANLPAQSLVNYQRTVVTRGEVVVTSTSWTSIDSNLTFNYTPVLSSSRILVMGEVHIAPHDSTGNRDNAGGSWAIWLNGVNVGAHGQAHEYYYRISANTSPDIYFGRTIQTELHTNTNGAALGIDIKARNYAGNNLRFFQGGNWPAIVHVYEYKT